MEAGARVYVSKEEQTRVFRALKAKPGNNVRVCTPVPTLPWWHRPAALGGCTMHHGSNPLPVSPVVVIGNCSARVCTSFCAAGVLRLR